MQIDFCNLEQYEKELNKASTPYSITDVVDKGIDLALCKELKEKSSYQGKVPYTFELSNIFPSGSIVRVLRKITEEKIEIKREDSCMITIGDNDW